jgi:HrpA-like RNA helicase
VSLLPVGAVLNQVIAALQQAQQVLLHAPTGAGKSTWLPLQILKSGLFPGKILLLEPRRLAAKSVAYRLAQQLGEQPGQTVGYRMRAESKTSAETRLEVVTEGILTRMVQQDPELADYSLVVLDEFHERSLQADLALALLLDVQQGLREDLRLLIMSAPACRRCCLTRRSLSLKAAVFRSSAIICRSPVMSVSTKALRVSSAVSWPRIVARCCYFYPAWRKSPVRKIS